MNQEAGKYLMGIGAFILLVGLTVYFFYDKLHWFGKLPGDIRIEKENFRFYFPVATMLLISIVLSILIKIWRKFF